MNIQDYKKTIKKALRPRTVTFLLKENKVLLGLKKRGSGKDNLLGIGGKVEPGETIEDGVTRELYEEIMVKPLNLHKVAILNFYFPHIEDESWNQQVHVFTTTEWVDNPVETEEIKPEWFNKENIPYDRMWEDAHYWLPQILTGKHIEGEFIFSKQD